MMCLSGFIIYFAYGIQHDGLHVRNSEDYVELDGSNGDIDSVLQHKMSSESSTVLGSGNGKAVNEVTE